MKKHGDFFINNVLGIVIAVIGIVVFVYAFTRLYDYNVDQEKEKAQSVLSSLIDKANALPEQVSSLTTIQGVDDWYLAGWSDSEVNKPDRCYDKSCVCICKDSPSSPSCQESVCLRVEQSSVFVRTDAFNYTSDGGFAQDTSTVHLRCIPLESRLHEVKVQRNASTLSITSQGDSTLNYAPCELYAPNILIQTHNIGGAAGP